MRIKLRNLHAFTLPEALIGGALFIVTLSAMLYSMSGARKEEELSTLYMSVMESAAIATHQLHTDLRQMVILSHKPLEPYSMRISDDYRSIRLRHATLPASATADTTAPARFIYVEYGLVPADNRPGRFHLSRTERTSDGSKLPGKNQSSVEKVFRTCLLRRASFLTKGDPETRTQVLHVGLGLISDTGAKAPRRRRERHTFDEKILYLTNVLQIQQPEPPYSDPTFFAEQIDVPDAEVPPGDVLSTAVGEVTALPPFNEVSAPEPTAPPPTLGGEQLLATESPPEDDSGGTAFATGGGRGN